MRNTLVAGAVLALMAGTAAHAEEITDKTRCTAMIAALNTDQRAKIRPYVLYVLNAMEAMDSDNTQRGDPGIMAAMSDKGRINMAVGADLVCRAHPQMTVWNAAAEMYRGMRDMEIAFGAAK
jgi:hypothetical protein